MRITKSTKTKYVLPFLTKEVLEELLEKVPEKELEKPILSMTISEFASIILDEDAFIESTLKKKYAFDSLGTLKSYKRQIGELTSFLKKYEIKQSAKEKRAAIGIDFPDLVSRMLLTVTKFFGLKSFEEAEKVPLASYLMIMQDESSSIMYQRAYSDLINKENELKNKKK